MLSLNLQFEVVAAAGGVIADQNVNRREEARHRVVMRLLFIGLPKNVKSQTSASKVS